jgi:phosphoglycerol transferase MdoB-like AlkP superfamily enzyme
MGGQSDTKGFTGFFRAWAASLIIAGALVCTLLVKLYWAIHINRLNEWISWVESDIFVLAAVELLLVIVCFIWPKRAVVRIITFLAALVCTWSVINAGWLIATGTQVLPAVLAPLFYDPVSRFIIVGHHLAMRPFAAVALLAPSAIALAFFFYILTKPIIPPLGKNHIRVRIIIYIVLFVLAAVFSVITKDSAKTTALAELRYNSQFKAIKSLFYKNVSRQNNKNPIDRKIPLDDGKSIAQLPLQNKKNAGKFNVVIVVLEGISPLQTNLFNKGSADVPFLKSLAKKGTAFTNCHTVATHTTKALFAIHTGRYPSVSQDYIEAATANYPYQSIATILKNSFGYRTAFFQSADGTFEARPGLVHNLGFDKFFTRQDITDANSYLGYLAADEFVLIEPICQWIKQSESPFLLTVLGSATHDPYEIPKWYASGKAADLKDPQQRYRTLISYTDAFLKELYDRICEITGNRKLIFCVIGDHGEAFGQHSRYGHARVPYDEAMKIFWIMSGDNAKRGKKINLPVSNIDVTPTILKSMGFDVSKETFDGINALRKISPGRKIYFSTWMDNGPTGYICGQKKFIYDPTNELVIKFDLSKDPAELAGQLFQREKLQDMEKDITEILSWQRQMFIDLYHGNIEKYQRVFDNWLCQTDSREPKAVYNKR